jgi:hypothetical protein
MYNIDVWYKNTNIKLLFKSFVGLVKKKSLHPSNLRRIYDRHYFIKLWVVR